MGTKDQDAPMSYLDSFEAEDRKRKFFIVGIAAALLVICLSVLIGTAQTMGTMNADVAGVFGSEKVNDKVEE